MARTKKSEALEPIIDSELQAASQTDSELSPEPGDAPQTELVSGQAPQTDPELFPEEPWTESQSPPDSQTDLEELSEAGSTMSPDASAGPVPQTGFKFADDPEDRADLQYDYHREPAPPGTDLESALDQDYYSDPSSTEVDELPLSQTDLKTPPHARAIVTRGTAAGKSPQTDSGQPQRLRIPGSRGPRVVSIDAERTVETDMDRQRSDFLDMVESLKSGKILTGTVQGVARMRFDPEKIAAVVYHGDFKVLIPALEMIEEPEDYRGRPKSEVLYYLLQKRMSAEVDYIIKVLDSKTGIISGSRLEAMAMKRREYYYRTDRDGNYQIYSGIRAEARVVSVIRAGIFVDLFGAECYIPLRELSYQRWMDANTHFQPGQRVLVKVLEVDRSNRNMPRVTASVKQAGENPYEKAMKKYDVGNRYVGTVSMVDTTGVFVSLDGGIDCLCTYPKRGRPPRGCRVTVRILGINHESNRIWGVITHMSTAR